MQDIAVLLRFLQLYAHNAHNTAAGPTFFQDHGYFGELYPAYEEAYDSVIERMIGLDIDVHLIMVQDLAVGLLKHYPEDKPNMKSCYSLILQTEQKLCSHIEALIPHLSEGTKQLLGGIADDSEKRQYKIKRRLK